MERHVTSRTPDDTNALRLKKPKTKAAGILLYSRQPSMALLKWA